MKVARLPKDPGPAGWNALLPKPGLATPLEGKATADWLIIGAGFAGLAAAHRLSQTCPGDRITILDATRIGDGPAGRNSGFMIDLPHDLASSDYGGALERDKLQTQDNRMAIDFAEEMAQAYGLPPEAFVRSGKTNAAASPRGMAHNKSYAQHLKSMGEPHELLNAAQMQEMTGTAYYQGGLFTPGTVMLQPAAFVRGIAQGLKSNRVHLHELSPVTKLEHQTDWVATTPKGQITAPKVILAVNGHLESFGIACGQLMHVFTYASMTRVLTAEDIKTHGGQPNWGVTPADPLGTTVRRISGKGDDRIIIRNRFTFDPSLEVTDKRIASVAKTHDKAFAARFPMLKGVQMEHRWGGRLCLSRNDVQMVQEAKPNLFTACVQNGLGTVKGTLAGMMAADLATNKPSEALTRITSQAAPKRLPPNPIAKLGATARLLWGEAMAGKEL